MRRIGLICLVTAGAALVAAQPGAAQPNAGSAALARSVLVKLHTVEQVRLVMDKLAPVFSESVLARTAGTPDDPFASVVKTPEGKARLKAVLAEEFGRAYAAYLPELTDTLVAHLATDLSEADLRAVSAFLDTPAGAHWAAEMIVFQQQSSASGASIGARAGADAVSATLKRMAVEPGASK